LNKGRRFHINDFNFDESVGQFAGLNIPPKKSFASQSPYSTARDHQQKLLAAWSRERPTLFLSNKIRERARSPIVRYAGRNRVEDASGISINFFHLDCPPRGFIVREGFDDLLRRPFGSRFCCHIEVVDFPPIVEAYGTKTSDL